MVEALNSFPDFTGAFGDKRIAKRAEEVLQKLTRGRTSSIRQITESAAEQRSFYRLFNNDSFSETAIEKSITERCGQLCKGRHVLCIQDTTEFNLNGQRGRIKKKSGLGQTASDEVLGFLMHSSLVVDAGSTHALGFSFVQLWERKEETPDRHDRKYQQLPIEEKESYKWIAATNQSKKLLHQAVTMTIVADRESDIYELLATVPDSSTHLLLRSNANRMIEEGGKLEEHLNQLPVMHTYSLPINGDIRKGIQKRVAEMELKWSQVAVQKPKKCKAKTLPSSTEVSVVEVREKNHPSGIYWRILTTHPVSNAGEAQQIIAWYKQRWHIEQIHRLLKTEGFRIEKSQLEQGWAIRKLTLLSLMATLRILQMMLAYEDDQEQQPIAEVFSTQEEQCLQMLNVQMQGNTPPQKNPARPKTLNWATWVIARLGGWKGYTSQRKPGPIVLQKGLAKFYQIYHGWTLYQTFNKDVYTP